MRKQSEEKVDLLVPGGVIQPLRPPPPFSNEPGVSEKSLASQLLHFGVKTYHLIDFISADSQTHDNQGKTGLPLFLENLERFGNSKMVRKKSGKMQKKIWKTSWNLCNVGKFV